VTLRLPAIGWKACSRMLQLQFTVYCHTQDFEKYGRSVAWGELVMRRGDQKFATVINYFNLSCLKSDVIAGSIF
jgi:hypothetical protein